MRIDRACWLTLLAASWLLPDASWAYTLLSYDPAMGINTERHGGSHGLVARWDLDSVPDGTIRYWVNLARPEGAEAFAPDESLVRAVQRAFQVWEDIPDCRLRFAMAGSTELGDAFDGTSVVTFRPAVELPTGFPGGLFPVFWLGEEGGALTVEDCDLCVQPGAMYVLDADGPLPFAVFDFEGVLVHEIGHMIGLDHSGLGQTTMCAYASYGGARFNKALSPDDMLGASTLYPEPGFVGRVGRIHGTVTRRGGGPIAGAQVVAISAATGCAVASAVTGLAATDADGLPAAYDLASGDFLLCLAPGEYRLLVEPFGNEAQGVTYVGGILGSAAGGELYTERDFAAVLGEESVHVEAGEVAEAPAIAVRAQRTRTPVVGRASDWFRPSDSLVWDDPARLWPGDEGELQVNAGTGLTSEDAPLRGLKARFLAEGLHARATGVSDQNRLRLDVDADADVPPGDHVLVLETPAGVTYYPGAVRVLAPGGE